jgi:hypothetical protein
MPEVIPEVMSVLAKLPANQDIMKLYMEEPHPNADMSKMLWKLELELFRAGLTADEVFVIAKHAKCNKYHSPLRPKRLDADGDLWREVLRASQSFGTAPTAEYVLDEIDKRTEKPVDFLTEDERDIVATSKTFVDWYVDWSQKKTDAAVEYKKFTKKELPEGSLPLSEWIDSELDQVLEQKLANVVQYIINRGFDPLENHFLWSPVDGFSDRVILPFTYNGENVGWTARKIRDGKPKYLSDQHPNYVFNLDRQTYNQKYVFVCEGPFDALSVGGVALLHNDISEAQATLINKLGKTVIVIPDRDEAGLEVIKRAMELDWEVAFCNWDDDIKDAAAAVEKYGSLFVITDAVSTSVAGSIKINLYMKKLQKLLENSSR